MKPCTSRATTMGFCPTLAYSARARSITAGSVQGAGTSSTSGTSEGGLIGWPTRQRARPFKFSVKLDAVMPEVELARIASGEANASSWAKKIGRASCREREEVSLVRDALELTGK